MMLSRSLVALALSSSTASAVVYQGFNYGASTDWNKLFSLAKSLAGTDGAFTSARLYTMVEQGTTNIPTSAIQAAISNDVTLLLGLWASAGQDFFNDEIAALTEAIATYGTAFTSRVVAIGVGSEDLYRITPTGIKNKSGVGADPTTLVAYISQVRAVIANTSLSGALVGHIDTTNAWINSSNAAVIAACDFLGMDAYPFWELTEPNSVANGHGLFFTGFNQTSAVAGEKPVWITETGWPVSGPTENVAVADVASAKVFWDQVGCELFGNVNTFWYTLNDTGASPSFGLVGADGSLKYNLTCPATVSKSAVDSTSSLVQIPSSTAANNSSSTVATSSLETTAVGTALTSTSTSTTSALISTTVSTLSTTSSIATSTTTGAATGCSAPVTFAAAIFGFLILFM